MRHSRSNVAVLVAAFLVAAPAALAQQDFPIRPIRMIVPNPPGGATDVLARLLADELTATMGQPMVVDYKPGASGTIGSDLVAKSKPDGYTLVMGHAASHATSSSMIKDLPYDPVADFAPITLVANVTNIIVVNKDLPVKSVAELIALGKSNPRKHNFGSGGIGAITHLAGELFNQMAGTSFVHVPYKGSSQAMTDLIGGHVSMMFENMPGAMGHVQSGTIRALAVTSLKRTPGAPDIPTVAEAGVPGYAALSWFGVFAAAGTPKPIVDRLNGAMVAAIRKPELQEKMAKLGAEAVGNTPQEFRELVRSEQAKWSKVIREARIDPN
jgi:tripartite-type tricarboxylate transporter receptor subunit TctC